MSDTFDQHVRDYQRIEKNREIGLVLVPHESIRLIPSAETFMRVHARDPLGDLRRYFGCIKNATA